MSINSATSVQKNANSSNLGAEIGSSVLGAGLMSGGFGSITTLKNHRTNALKATGKNNEVLKAYASKLEGNDVFAKSIKTSYNYKEFTSLAKRKAKLERLANKKNIPLFQRFKNLFRSEEKKVTIETYKAKASDAIKNYNDAEIKLRNGESISDEVFKNSKTKLEAKLQRLNVENPQLPLTEKIKNLFRKEKLDVDGYKTKINAKINALPAKALDNLDSAKTFFKTTKGVFKSELKDPFGITFAVVETAQRFTGEALPAFKNEGFIAGLKATGKALAAGVATWVTDAGLSVVFRNVGATVGSIFGPVGTAIGSIIGNGIGGLMSTKLVQKLIPMKEPQEQEAIAQAPQETIQEAPQQIATAQTTATVEQPVQKAPKFNADEANLKLEQAKKLAKAKVYAKHGIQPNGSMNSYFA